MRIQNWRWPKSGALRPEPPRVLSNLPISIKIMMYAPPKSSPEDVQQAAELLTDAVAELGPLFAQALEIEILGH